MNNKYAWLRRLPILIGLGLSLLVILAIFLLKDQFEKPAQRKKVVQQITMITPPPPPPPPEEKPPEPEIEEPEPEPEVEPEPAPEESNEPAGEELGLDADGSAGSDGFGLAARKGGRSLLGGGPGSAVLWYGGQVRQRVEDNLQKLLVESSALKTGYAVTIDVWVDTEGRISRSRLRRGSGNAEVDQALRNALNMISASVGQAPPENMPQPIHIKLTSRI
ncbi:MAG: TonB family protein [Methylococcales bacterium]|nr:TonB family protein [Methylococcales bacterium]